MAPIQKDATGTQFRDPVVVCAQVVLVLTVVAIVLLIVGVVLGVFFPVMEKTSAMENVGMVHKKRGLIMTQSSPNVGLHYECHHIPSSNTGMIQ